jgi:hypothetical protein
MADVLLNILSHTYHPDKMLRTQAEKALEDYLKAAPVALLALTQFVKNHTLDVGIRKAAAIQLKNKIKPFWDPSNIGIFSQEQRDAVKSEVVLTILEETDNSIRRLLAEAFRKIMEFDYPERWPNLLSGVLAMAQTSDVLRMHNALVLLRQMAKRYEMKAT